MRNCWLKAWRMMRTQRGFSLVEVLVALAITGMVSSVVGAVVLSNLGANKRLQDQTNHYESLRLPAAMMMQDARFARTVSCGFAWDSLTLASSGTDYVVYKFASWDGNPFGGTPDSKHLHRWEIRGGVLYRDAIVGWDLVPPDGNGSPGTSFFACRSDPTFREGKIRMAKPPLPGQAEGIQLEVTAFLRS